jgi:hypothetical protein
MKNELEVIDPGHVYNLRQLGTDEKVELRFKRSGGAIKYDEEWPGLQVQEVLRALIDRTQYLYDVLPCNESSDALWHLRMALWAYEARAHRRKMEEVNREQPAHDDTERTRLWRDREVSDWIRWSHYLADRMRAHAGWFRTTVSPSRGRPDR